MLNRSLSVYANKSLLRYFFSKDRIFFNGYLMTRFSRVLSGSCNLPTEAMVWRTSRFSMNSGVISVNFCSDSVVMNSNRCWNCGTNASSLPFLACGSCKSVQPVDLSVNYFEIFGMEKSYEIRVDNLENLYKDWQKKLHPDLFHSKAEKDKTYAAEQSSRVIDAYRTLRNPLSRALYLLELEGVHFNEGETISDPMLLVEMMDVREAVEEATESQALKHIQSEIQHKLDYWSDSFNMAYKSKEFGCAVKSIQRMIYYMRAIDEIVKKL